MSPDTVLHVIGVSHLAVTINRVARFWKNISEKKCKKHSQDFWSVLGPGALKKFHPTERDEHPGRKILILVPG